MTKYWRDQLHVEGRKLLTAPVLFVGDQTNRNHSDQPFDPTSKTMQNLSTLTGLRADVLRRLARFVNVVHHGDAASELAAGLLKSRGDMIFDWAAGLKVEKIVALGAVAQRSLGLEALDVGRWSTAVPDLTAFEAEEWRIDVCWIWHPSPRSLKYNDKAVVRDMRDALAPAVELVARAAFMPVGRR